MNFGKTPETSQISKYVEVAGTYYKDKTLNGVRYLTPASQQDSSFGPLVIRKFNKWMFKATMESDGLKINRRTPPEMELFTKIYPDDARLMKMAFELSLKGDYYNAFHTALLMQNPHKAYVLNELVYAQIRAGDLEGAEKLSKWMHDFNLIVSNLAKIALAHFINGSQELGKPLLRYASEAYNPKRLNKDCNYFIHIAPAQVLLGDSEGASATLGFYQNLGHDTSNSAAAIAFIQKTGGNIFNFEIKPVVGEF